MSIRSVINALAIFDSCLVSENYGKCGLVASCNFWHASTVHQPDFFSLVSWFSEDVAPLQHAFSLSFDRCLTPNADVRPDIIEVSSRISDIMMKFVDNLCASYNSLERRAERDRKRAQKYFLESNRTRMCGPLQPVRSENYWPIIHHYNLSVS